MTSVTVKIQNY